MSFKLNRDNFNFGKGTKGYSSPNKLGRVFGWGGVAAEGYYKAYQNYKNKKKKKKADIEEAQRINETIENAKSTGHMPTSATHNMVQVWDENLGRKRWVHNPEAYKEQQDKKKKEESTSNKVDPPKVDPLKVNPPKEDPPKEEVVEDKKKNKKKKKKKPKFRYNI